MNELEALADRHLRPDPQGVLLPRHARRVGRVLLTVDTVMATTAAGQHTAWMLVNLLARQFGIVSSITLDVAHAALIDKAAPFGDAESLCTTLEHCVGIVAGNHMGVSVLVDEDKQFDVCFVIGYAARTRRSEPTWYLYADGWRWYVGRGASMPRIAPSRGLSFGPYLASCAAAGEAFKILRGLEPGKGGFIDECFGSAWTMTLSDSWDMLADGPDAIDLRGLPHAYFAGAGAVAQAAALALGSSGLGGNTTAVDHDILDITNDNRYVLSGKADDGQPKVNALSLYLDRCGMPCNPVACKWQEYVSSLGRRATDPAVRATEQRSRFATILSCVDKNDARHAIQNLVPELILGGSTDGLTAKVSVYSLDREGACLKCFNPVEDRNAIIKQRVAKAREMTPDQQGELCRELGVVANDLERLLTASGCGKLAEADLERFAKELPQMSVGFVSAAAGVLLAAQLIRITALGVEGVLDNGQMVAMTFARPGFRHYRLARDETCDCASRLRNTWQSLWSPNSYLPSTATDARERALNCVPSET